MTEDVDWKFLPIQGTCDQCHNPFARPEHLAVHLPCFMNSDKYVDRPTGSGKAFRCQFCLMDYACIQGLVAHILFHFDKQYVCLHCHAGFYTRKTVMQHASEFHSRFVPPVEELLMPLDEHVLFDADMEEHVIMELPPAGLHNASIAMQEANMMGEVNVMPEVTQPGFLDGRSSPFFDPPPMFLDPNDIIIMQPEEHAIQGLIQVVQAGPSESAPIQAPEVSQSQLESSSPKPKPKKKSQLEKIFICCICNRGYKTRNGMIRHERGAHDYKRPPPARPVVPVPKVPVLQLPVLQGPAAGEAAAVIVIDVGDRQLKILPDSELNGKKDGRTTKKKARSSKKKAPAAEAGPVKPGKRKKEVRQHKENGINHKMLLKRAREEAKEEEMEDMIPLQEQGTSRKLYCKNSKWKRMQEEREEEERRKRNDPKLSMPCFVELIDIFDCHVFLQEDEERDGVMIYR